MRPWAANGAGRGQRRGDGAGRHRLRRALPAFGGPKRDIAARLSEKYPREEAEETVAELHQLIAEGYLDTPDDYSDVKPADSGVVKAMCLHAAHDCNLRCKYCFADTGEYHMHSRCLLSAETGKKALDWLVKHSGNRRNLEVDFFGGEPLMNFPVIKEVVAYGRS